MRDIGILVWVVFLIVGVAGSIASSARKQLAGTAPGPGPVRGPAPRLAPPIQPPQSVQRPQPPPRVAPVARPATAVHEEPVRATRRFFADRQTIVRAVIAAEVLGKPRALRDE